MVDIFHMIDPVKGIFINILIIFTPFQMKALALTKRGKVVRSTYICVNNGRRPVWGLEPEAKN